MKDILLLSGSCIFCGHRSTQKSSTRKNFKRPPPEPEGQTTIPDGVVDTTPDPKIDFFRFWMFFGCFSSVTRSGGFKSLCKYQKSILHQILRFYSGGENFLVIFQLETMKKSRFWLKIQLISQLKSLQ